jgi:hypothetical protein
MTSDTVDDRAVAVATYNRCWDLLDQGTRTAAEDAELLTAAFTSRYHWQIVGGETQTIVADWMVSRAAGETGAADVAVRFAHLAQEGVEGTEQEPWLRASILEGLARAYAQAGDRDRREEYLQAAWAALDEEPDPENREVIAEQIQSVPEVA